MEPELFERILDQTLGEPKLTERPILVLPVSKYFASVYKICQAMVDSSRNLGMREMFGQGVTDHGRSGPRRNRVHGRLTEVQIS